MLKARFVEYTDATFTTRVAVAPGEEYRGILGPVLRAEVGDIILVTLLNRASFAFSLHTHGLLYRKPSEGNVYNDGTNSMGAGRGNFVEPGHVRLSTQPAPRGLLVVVRPSSRGAHVLAPTTLNVSSSPLSPPSFRRISPTSGGSPSARAPPKTTRTPSSGCTTRTCAKFSTQTLGCSAPSSSRGRACCRRAAACPGALTASSSPS